MSDKKFDRRLQLMEAALDEFIHNNYEQASLNAIIKNAAISKGVFYYHFKNKEALYLALLEEATHKKWDYIREHTSTTTYEAQTLFDRFFYQTDISLEFAAVFPKYHQLSGMFQKEKGTPIYETALTHIGSIGSDVLDTMIEDAYNNGELDSHYPLAFIKELLGHLFREFDSIFPTQHHRELDTQKETLAHYYRFMQYGLAPTLPSNSGQRDSKDSKS